MTTPEAEFDPYEEPDEADDELAYDEDAADHDSEVPDEEGER